MPDARTLYRENAVQGARPVRLVVLLYEQMVEDLRRAVRAMDENRVDARTNAVNHALVVLAHLEGELDTEAGGEVARRLAHFYNVLRRTLMEAQFKASKQMLNEQIPLLLDLRDAWTQVDQAEGSRSTLGPKAADTSTDIDQQIHADWKA